MPHNHKFVIWITWTPIYLCNTRAHSFSLFAFALHSCCSSIPCYPSLRLFQEKKIKKNTYNIFSFSSMGVFGLFVLLIPLLSVSFSSIRFLLFLSFYAFLLSSSGKHAGTGGFTRAIHASLEWRLLLVPLCPLSPPMSEAPASSGRRTRADVASIVGCVLSAIIVVHWVTRCPGWQHACLDPPTLHSPNKPRSSTAIVFVSTRTASVMCITSQACAKCFSMHLASSD